MQVFVAGIKVLIWVACEITQAFCFVFCRMRVNKIHNNGKPVLVCGIYQPF